MYAQLGKIIFKGLFGFNDLSYSGDEAIYGELELINQKPTLQKTGDTLQEITASVTMRIEFCNPKQQIQDLQKYKTDGEILPLLMGDGTYVGDYVITSMPYDIDDAFSDGTIIQATVTLNLKECVSNNKLEQKQISARKKALAVGDKQAIVIRNLQAPALDKQASLNITEIKQQTLKTNALVAALENNPPAKPMNAQFLKDSLLKSKDSIVALVKKIEGNVAYFSAHPDIKTFANIMLSNTDALLGTYPFTDLPLVKDLNNNLQLNNKSLNTVSNGLLQKVIIRR